MAVDGCTVACAYASQAAGSSLHPARATHLERLEAFPQLDLGHVDRSGGLRICCYVKQPHCAIRVYFSLGLHVRQRLLGPSRTLTGREATVWGVATHQGRRKWTAVNHALFVALPPQVTPVSAAHIPRLHPTSRRWGLHICQALKRRTRQQC